MQKITRHLLGPGAVGAALIAMLVAAPGQGLIPSGHVIGNGTSADRTPTDTAPTLILDQALCATDTAVAARISGAWGCSTTSGAPVVFGGNLTGQQQVILSGRADATIASDLNNYNPTGYATASSLYIDGGAGDRNITGLSGGAAGRTVIVVNKGATNNLVLKNLSVSSSAANQFSAGTDVTIEPNRSRALIYDATANVWRVMGAPGNQTITLSGDVTGSGTTAITTALSNIGNDVTMAGDLLATMVVQPATPAAGKARVYVDSGSKTLSMINDGGVVKIAIIPSSAGSHQFATGISSSGAISYAQPAVGDLQNASASRLLGNPTGSPAVPSEISLGSTLAFSGSALQTAAHTGDVTTAANSFTTTLVNIPNDVAMAGDLLSTNIAAPTTPASGKTRCYVDSTNKTFSCRNDAGSTSFTAFASSAPANQVANGLNSAGSLTYFQVAFSNLSGTIASGQFATGPGVIVGNMFANATASTLFGNTSTSGAAPTFFTISSLTSKASPAASDLVLIQDQAASGQLKQATVASIASAGSVSSIDSKTGAFTTGNGLDTSGNVIELTAARRTLPTTQVLTSGSSATYTTPANVLWLRVRMVGGGGGGSGSGTASIGAGGTGGNTTFSTLTANGATGGNSGAAGNGGTASGCDVNIVGSAGQSVVAGLVNGPSGVGATSPFGGAGPNGAFGGAGSTAAANSGSGGGGGGAPTGGGTGGTAGGGAGGYCEKTITSPGATFTYTIGTGGSAGTAGTGGSAGGAGAAGIVIVNEFYN